MAEQNGLYLDFENGQVKQLGAGDTIAASSLGTGTPDSTKYLRGDGIWQVPPGGGTTIYSVTQNLGGPSFRGKFTVVNASIAITSKINIWQAFEPISGKGTLADENEMDSLIVRAEAIEGEMVVYWQTQPQYTMSPPSPQGNGIDTRTVTQDSNKALWTMKRIGNVKGSFIFNYLIL